MAGPDRSVLTPTPLTPAGPRPTISGFDGRCRQVVVAGRAATGSGARNHARGGS